MTFSNRHLTIWLAIPLLLLLLGLASPAAAIGLTLSPASPTVSPGETVSFTLFSSDPAPSVIGGYDIDIAFDASVISVASFVPTNALGDLVLGEAFDFSFGDATPGILNLSVLSTLDATQLSPIQQGQVPLATFSIVVGLMPPPGATTSLTLGVNVLSDGAAIDVGVTSLSGATLTLIPEPSTALLLGAGLGLLARTRGSRSPRDDGRVLR